MGFRYPTKLVRGQRRFRTAASRYAVLEAARSGPPYLPHEAGKALREQARVLHFVTGSCLGGFCNSYGLSCPKRPEAARSVEGARGEVELA